MRSGHNRASHPRALVSSNRNWRRRQHLITGLSNSNSPHFSNIRSSHRNNLSNGSKLQDSSSHSRAASGSRQMRRGSSSNLISFNQLLVSSSRFLEVTISRRSGSLGSPFNRLSSSVMAQTIFTRRKFRWTETISRLTSNSRSS